MATGAVGTVGLMGPKCLGLDEALGSVKEPETIAGAHSDLRSFRFLFQSLQLCFPPAFATYFTTASKCQTSSLN